MKRSQERLLTGLAVTSVSVAAVLAIEQKKALPKTPAVKTLENIGRQGINGCNPASAKNEIFKRVKDGTSFTAEVFKGYGQPLPLAMAVSGNKAVVDPIILECNNKEVAIAGLVNAQRVNKDSSYNPVRIYGLPPSSTNTPLTEGVSIGRVSMHFIPDKVQLPSQKGPNSLQLVAEYKGFTGPYHLSYGMVVEEKYANPIVSMLQQELLPRLDVPTTPQAFS